jgi:transposase
VFAAIVLVLTTGCAWRHLPPIFGVSHQTAHRRFTEWSEAGLWAKLHRAVLDHLGAAGEIDWSRAIVDGASLRSKKGITDRPKPGRSRQGGQQDPRPHRPERPTARTRCLGREHA